MRSSASKPQPPAVGNHALSLGALTGTSNEAAGAREHQQVSHR